jgi:hypothetical protein
MEHLALLIVGAIVVIVLAFLACGHLSLRGDRRSDRARAELQFRNYRASASDGRLLLDGQTAQILDLSDSYNSRNGLVSNYTLTVFALSPQGKHFVFKSNVEGMPYVAALTPERAKLVLKHKYRQSIECVPAKNQITVDQTDFKSSTVKR